MLQINNSQKAYFLFKSLGKKQIEEFWLATLRPDKTVIKKQCVFRGTVDYCDVHLRDIFRLICKQNASSFIIAHNHPQTNPRPSSSDHDLTRRILKASLLFDIPLIDHIIVSRNDYFSFCDFGLLKSSSNRLKKLPSKTQELPLVFDERF